MAVKRTTAEIQRSILNALKDGQKSIKAIARECQIEWLVAKRNLEHLEIIGNIERVKTKIKSEKSPILYRLIPKS